MAPPGAGPAQYIYYILYYIIYIYIYIYPYMRPPRIPPQVLCVRASKCGEYGERASKQARDMREMREMREREREIKERERESTSSVCSERARLSERACNRERYEICVWVGEREREKERKRERERESTSGARCTPAGSRAASRRARVREAEQAVGAQQARLAPIYIYKSFIH